MGIGPSVPVGVASDLISSMRGKMKVQELVDILERIEVLKGLGQLDDLAILLNSEIDFKNQKSDCNHEPTIYPYAGGIKVCWPTGIPHVVRSSEYQIECIKCGKFLKPVWEIL